MRERTLKALGTLFIAALLAAPAAWAQDWRGSSAPAGRDPLTGARNGNAAKLQPSVNVGSSSSILVAEQPTDAKARKARRDQLAAQQTGVNPADGRELQAAISEDSNSMLTGDQIRKTDYNPVASQLTDSEGLMSSQASAMAEDRAFGCSAYSYLANGFQPGLIGDVFVTPPDGLPPLGADLDETASGEGDDG